MGKGRQAVPINSSGERKQDGARFALPILQLQVYENDPLNFLFFMTDFQE
jgi:hypothetical protein